MTRNILSHKQSGGITAEKVSLNNTNFNEKSSIEGIWTKLGVTIAFLTLLFAVLEFILKVKI